MRPKSTKNALFYLIGGTLAVVIVYTKSRTLGTASNDRVIFRQLGDERGGRVTVRQNISTLTGGQYLSHKETEESNPSPDDQINILEERTGDDVNTASVTRTSLSDASVMDISRNWTNSGDNERQTTKPTSPTNTNLSAVLHNLSSLVALASAPGSGNTWVRHLLEEATGLFTGSVYLDKNLKRGGFIGEKTKWDSGMTIAVKSHETWPSIRRFSGAIVLVRNPFQCIISEFNRKSTRNHNALAVWTEDTKDDEFWHSIVSNRTQWWEDFANAWLTTFDKPILVSRYDDLLNNTIAELTRMLDFLKIPGDNRRWHCVLNDMEGKFHRHSDVDQKLQYASFTPEMRKRITAALDRVSALLVKRGYTPPERILELELR
uniref:WSC domain-containing protein 1-like n=1 Tax=Saccoglossus kowalevskii TaxID=10224 RepID=A0ABM0MYV8_SACKO|nr:PREDICTED: WSC domain-containing protein 1-like [Saccoglossus kowalevskii]